MCWANHSIHLNMRLKTRMLILKASTYTGFHSPCQTDKIRSIAKYEWVLFQVVSGHTCAAQRGNTINQRIFMFAHDNVILLTLTLKSTASIYIQGQDPYPLCGKLRQQNRTLNSITVHCYPQTLSSGSKSISCGSQVDNLIIFIGTACWYVHIHPYVTKAPLCQNQP